MEKIISLIMNILSAIFATLFLIFALVGVYHYQFDTTIISEYKENWDRGPIIDIIEGKKSQCPDGYGPFISDTFPGIRDGCDCTKSDDPKLSGNILDITCDSYHIVHKCKMIFEKKDIALIKWRGASLCVARMKKNFWNLVVPLDSGSCPNGMKKCGVLDSFKNIMCVSSNEKCPINDIDIRHALENPTAYQGYKRILLNDDYLLYFTNEHPDNPVIVEIEARESQYCAHPYEGELGQSTYLLNKKQGPAQCQTKIGDRLIDSRFEVLDTQKTLSFYDESGITRMVKYLPQYPMPDSQSQVTLYKINYFGWNKLCLNKVDYSEERLVDPSNEVKSNYRKTYSLCIMAIVHFIFIFLSIVVYKLILEPSLPQKAIFIVDALHFLLLIILFILAIVITQSTVQLLIPYQSYISNKCGDELTDAALELSFAKINMIPGYIRTISILSMIEAGMMVIYYIWYYAIRKN